MSDIIAEISVPGRVCLFGEHSDWAGGYRTTNPEIVPGLCIVTGTDETIDATVRSHSERLVCTMAREDGTRIGPWECSMDESALLEVAQAGGFWSYIAGVAYQERSNTHAVPLTIC